MKLMEADIIVVAGGPAGLAAANAAAEGGASVIVFEKSATTGGAANMGMGIFAVESCIQQQGMIGLTKEEVFERFMRATQWKVNARLVRDYFWKSADTVQWLMDMGVQFFAAMKYFPGSEATWHVVAPEGGGLPGARAASTMYRIMTEHAKELGVTFMLETPVTKLLKDDNKVYGVIAKGKDGEEIEARAKAVIVATGGFGDNPEMIKKMTGYEMGVDYYGIRVPGMVGDGLRMAWEVGAGKSQIMADKIFMLPTALDLNYGPLGIVFMQPNLVVNLQGERVMNEALMEHTAYTANVIDRQQGKFIVSIIDDSIIKRYRKNGLDVPSAVFPGNAADVFGELFGMAKDTGDQFIFEADSIEELAAQVGIDSESLEETIKDYNNCCAQNYDDLYDKNRKFLKPLKGPKFYAAKMYISSYGLLGGIKINYKTEVITEDYKVIPGLYAAGNDVNDIYGGTYIFEFPGNTMGFAVNSGRMAGEYAADYINSL